MDNLYTTKDGVMVEKNQVWHDMDKRVADRYAKVEAVRDGKAIMYRCTVDGRIINAVREIKVAVARMHKHSTGWALVHGANGKVTTMAPVASPASMREQLTQYSIEE